MKHAVKSSQNDEQRLNFARLPRNRTILVIFIVILKALLMKIRHSNLQNSNFSILVDCRKGQNQGLGNLYWFTSLISNTFRAQTKRFEP